MVHIFSSKIKLQIDRKEHRWYFDYIDFYQITNENFSCLQGISSKLPATKTVVNKSGTSIVRKGHLCGPWNSL